MSRDCAPCSRRGLLHPVVGPLEVDCEVMVSDEHGQQLIIYTARPGTESAERLDLLRVVGLQDLTAKEAKR